MAMPRDIAIIDTFLGILPSTGAGGGRHFSSSMFRDGGSREGGRSHPAGYMFKAPDFEPSDNPITDTLRQMDRFRIEKALIAIGSDDARTAVREHPDRFLGQTLVDAHEGMDAVRGLVRDHETLGISAAAFFPAGHVPPLPINDARVYPIYAKCVELDIPIFVNAGVPGPRIPYASQDPGLVDEVCWFFPELRFVYRHGCEPWADLAVKLLLKWPNLYYSTSGFAPKHLPKAIIDFANTRGADKVLYAGYFPSGLTLDRIFQELGDLPLREHVWPKFLSENARRVLKIQQRAAA